MEISAQLEKEIDERITHYPVSKRSAVLPVLHALQHELGYISEESVEWTAKKLDLEPIKVLEVVTFYPGFRQSAPGKYHIRVCRTLSCAMAGSGELMEELCKKADIDRSETSHHDPIAVSKDGTFSIEFAECLASCGTGPVCLVNDDFHEAVAPEQADKLLDMVPQKEILNRGFETYLEMADKKIKYIKGKEPHEREHRLIFKNVDREGWDPSIDCYLKEGGYEQLKKSLEMEPAKITDEVKASGLRGRGGAGFPTGVKWGFIPPTNTKPVYLICNADESEPGTFKDRYIIHQDPHQLIEGMVISCFAVGAKLAYIYIREEFPEGAEILEKAIAEAREKGFLGKDIQGSGFDLEIYVHRGAGAYICGEETGLIESLEGKRPYPRIKPPYFPAALGLYMSPTIVNNVESLCHVKHIMEMGGEGYAKLGTPRNTGTRILCVSGDVQKPGYYEVEVGKITMGELLNDVCGGLKEGRKLKAVIPGGSSAKVLRGDEKIKIKQGEEEVEIGIEDIPMDFDTLMACGSMAGSGGVIVIDDSRRIEWVLNNINAFYAHESCGQCTPCREGSLWMKKISDRVVAGKASPEDIDTLESVAYNIDGRTICAFGEASSWPTESFIAKFRDELIAATDESNSAAIVNPETTMAAANLG